MRSSVPAATRRAARTSAAAGHIFPKQHPGQNCAGSRNPACRQANSPGAMTPACTRSLRRS